MDMVPVQAGYHFVPTDEELIKIFLLKKANGEEIVLKSHVVDYKEMYDTNSTPWLIFPEKDHPWFYDENFKRRVLYVFTKLSFLGGKDDSPSSSSLISSSSSRRNYNRKAGNGRWHGQNSKEIKDESTSKTIGHVRTFTFKPDIKEGMLDLKSIRKRYGSWCMYEYTLSGGVVCDMVLCKIIVNLDRDRAGPSSLSIVMDGEEGGSLMRMDDCQLIEGPAVEYPDGILLNTSTTTAAATCTCNTGWKRNSDHSIDQHDIALSSSQLQCGGGGGAAQTMMMSCSSGQNKKKRDFGMMISQETADEYYNKKIKPNNNVYDYDDVGGLISCSDGYGSALLMMDGQGEGEGEGEGGGLMITREEEEEEAVDYSKINISTMSEVMDEILVDDSHVHCSCNNNNIKREISTIDDTEEGVIINGRRSEQIFIGSRGQLQCGEEGNIIISPNAAAGGGCQQQQYEDGGGSGSNYDGIFFIDGSVSFLEKEEEDSWINWNDRYYY